MRSEPGFGRGYTGVIWMFPAKYIRVLWGIFRAIYWVFFRDNGKENGSY